MPYGNLTDGQAYWDVRDYEGTLTPELLEVASTFVDGLGWRMTRAGVPVSRFPGKPTSPTQDLQWPRSGAVDVYGREIADDVVPSAVERAVYEAARYEAQNEGALNAAIRADQRVVRERFDVVEFQYAEPSGSQMVGVASTTPVIPAVMALLSPVLTGGSNAYGITGVVV